MDHFKINETEFRGNMIVLSTFSFDSRFSLNFLKFLACPLSGSLVESTRSFQKFLGKNCFVFILSSIGVSYSGNLGGLEAVSVRRVK